MLPAYFVAFSLSFGFLVLLPFGDGHTWVPRMTLAFIFAFILWPHINIDADRFHLILYVENFFLGVLVGLPIALFVEYAASFGELIDTGRGQMVAQIYDPIMNQNFSQLGIVFRNAYWVLLLASGVLCHSIVVLAEAHTTIACFPKFGMTLLQDLGVRLLGISALFSAAFVLTDACIAVVSKVARGIGLNLIDFAIKLSITFGILYLATFYSFTPELPPIFPGCKP